VRLRTITSDSAASRDAESCIGAAFDCAWGRPHDSGGRSDSGPSGFLILLTVLVLLLTLLVVGHHGLLTPKRYGSLGTRHAKKLKYARRLMFLNFGC
jgi:hypothetical protein